LAWLSNAVSNVAISAASATRLSPSPAGLDPMSGSQRRELYDDGNT
jgi:hypothetical protein